MVIYQQQTEPMEFNWQHKVGDVHWVQVWWSDCSGTPVRQRQLWPCGLRTHRSLQLPLFTEHTLPSTHPQFFCRMTLY